MKNREEGEAIDADSVVVYDTVSIKQMEYEESVSAFYYPCPCGDLFELGLADIINGLRIATCPSCSLQIGVVISKAELEEISSNYCNLPISTLAIINSTNKVQTFESLL